jgi:hypothetical protein
MQLAYETARFQCDFTANERGWLNVRLVVADKDVEDSSELEGIPTESGWL